MITKPQKRSIAQIERIEAAALAQGIAVMYWNRKYGKWLRVNAAILERKVGKQ